MKQTIYCSLILISVYACNHIETEQTLSKSDLKYIRTLNQLDTTEKIYKFYSEFAVIVAAAVVAESSPYICGKNC
jgi:hypothetical protein